MSIINNIVNELDIALRTLADKKTGTDRNYPPEPIEKNSEQLSKNEKSSLILLIFSLININFCLIIYN